jgi:chemotaxis regulatin CheY-phosphate phosphatase CheZ
MTTATAHRGTAEQARLISEIWDTLALLKRPTSPEDIRSLVTEQDEFKSEMELRNINMQLKKEYRSGT